MHVKGEIYQYGGIRSNRMIEVHWAEMKSRVLIWWLLHSRTSKSNYFQFNEQNEDYVFGTRKTRKTWKKESWKEWWRNGFNFKLWKPMLKNHAHRQQCHSFKRSVWSLERSTNNFKRSVWNCFIQIHFKSVIHVYEMIFSTTYKLFEAIFLSITDSNSSSRTLIKINSFLILSHYLT